MEDKKQTVTVNIFGEEYPIKGNADSEYILKVASYLDGKMREISERNANKSPTKIAILAALNITDELFQAQSVTSREIKDLEEKTKTLIDWLDEKLPEESMT
ncbi:MAG: cell division protein ZapA [candidate division Zixibacteria bacterium]|nr:cell division protein ZapA [candidate division Zixibacteria bacterium]